jgi:hypothetical protein
VYGGQLTGRKERCGFDSLLAQTSFRLLPYPNWQRGWLQNPVVESSSLSGSTWKQHLMT